MDFRLTNEQVLFRNMAREFSEKNIRPLAKEIDRSEKIPLSLLKGMADLGLLGVTIPENYGGPGGNAVLAAVGAMEVARGDVSMALPVYYLLAAGWSSVISKYGTEEAKGEILPRIAKAEHFYRNKSTVLILFHLLLSGAIILFTAESMIHAIEALSYLFHIPPVITGVFAGLIGCLGEILVIHNYTVNPKGRIGDALIGVGMDNIVTTLGAAIVAMMGGIFLGGSSLIVIFVLILGMNTFLIGQVSEMKNYFILEKE